jgi:tRNA wybutosine-synthesizing protein 4
MERDNKHGAIFTAFDSIDCKNHMVKEGYTQKTDVLLEHIHGYLCRYGLRSMKRPPLINQGYFVRYHAFTSLINRFLSQYEESTNFQMIFLGSGYDSAPMRLSQEQGLTVVEVDFPEVIERKVEIYNDLSSRSIIEKGFTFHSSGVFQGQKHWLLSKDLSISSSTLSQELLSLGLKQEDPTIIITECVLIYMEKSSILEVLRTFNASFEKVAWLSYDMINPFDPFGKTMLRNINNAGIYLPGFESFPRIENQISRFLENGWNDAIAFTMLEYYRQSMKKEEKNKMNEIESLDEIEEWNLILSHYSFNIAVKGLAMIDWKLS